MKIAFIADEFPAVSETFVLNQVLGLIDLGHEVRVFSQNVPRLDRSGFAEFSRYKLEERTFCFNDIIPKNKLKRLIKGAMAMFRTAINDFPSFCRCLNWRKFGKEVFGLHLFLYYDFFSGMDVLLCHFGPNGIFGAQMKEIGFKGKLVTVFHGYDMTTVIQKQGENVYKELFIKGDYFLPISGFWMNRLDSLGCPRNKMRVQHMGVDLRKFNFKARAVTAGEPVNIVCVGRLVEKKGHEYVLKALEILDRKNINFRFFIAGDGPERNVLINLAKSAGLENKVFFLGPLDQAEVVELYEKAHLFVLASVTSQSGDMEGIPVVLMEAMACGIPVISTRHSGIPELVQDGESGFLVPERDVKALGEKIEYVILHPEIWAGLGKQGRDFVAKNFDLGKTNKELEELLKSL